MHITSFVNNPDDISPHSNEYAAGTVSSQSFEQRQAIERSRQTIQGYQFSRLGASFIDREVGVRVPKRRSVPRDTSGDGFTSRQQAANTRNIEPGTQKRTPHTFKEPPSRGYTPYS